MANHVAFDPRRPLPGNYASTVNAIALLQDSVLGVREDDWRADLIVELEDVPQQSNIHLNDADSWRSWWTLVVNALPAILDEDLQHALDPAELPDGFHPLVRLALFDGTALLLNKAEWFIADGTGRRQRANSTPRPSASDLNDAPAGAKGKQRAASPHRADAVGGASGSGVSGGGPTVEQILGGRSKTRSQSAAPHGAPAIRAELAVAQEQALAAALAAAKATVGAGAAAAAAAARHALDAGGPPAPVAGRDKAPSPRPRDEPGLAVGTTMPADFFPSLRELLADRDSSSSSRAISTEYADAIAEVVRLEQPSLLDEELPEFVTHFRTVLNQRNLKFADKEVGRKELIAGWTTLERALGIDLADVQKIALGQFVDFRDLRDYVPSNSLDVGTNFYDWVVGTHDKKRRKNAEQLNPVEWPKYFDRWALAFKAVNILVKEHAAEREHDLRRYRAFIMEELERPDDTRRSRVLTYDAWAREEVAKPGRDGQLKYLGQADRFEPQFVLTVLTPVARGLASSGGSSGAGGSRKRAASPAPRAKRVYPRGDRCGRWNDGEDCGAGDDEDPACGRAHRCMACGEEHRIVDCPQSGGSGGHSASVGPRRRGGARRGGRRGALAPSGTR